MSTESSKNIVVEEGIYITCKNSILTLLSIAQYLTQENYFCQGKIQDCRWREDFNFPRIGLRFDSSWPC